MGDGDKCPENPIPHPTGLLVKSRLMRLIVHPIPDPWKNARSWALLSGVALLWTVARTMAPTGAGVDLHGYPLPACPLRALTGIPCPFCGITTGSSWLVRGHWREAWESNILSPLLMIGSLIVGGYVLAFRLAAARTLAIDMEPRMRRIVWVAILALIVASWGMNLQK